MEYELTKIDAAVDQLDWAIRLFLDHMAYVPAITLAGADEEILGQAVGERAAFLKMRTKFALELSMSEKEVSQDHLNIARNFLKHWDQKRDQEKIRLDLEDEAIQFIVRALMNLSTHDGSQPSEGPRFFAWMAENRADLLED